MTLTRCAQLHLHQPPLLMSNNDLVTHTTALVDWIVSQYSQLLALKSHAPKQAKSRKVPPFSSTRTALSIYVQLPNSTQYFSTTTYKFMACQMAEATCKHRDTITQPSVIAYRQTTCLCKINQQHNGHATPHCITAQHNHALHHGMT